MPYSQSFEIRRVRDGKNVAVDDDIAVEEPLEIQIGYRDGKKRSGKSISVTMRTPGDDEELAAGFLFAEGTLKSPEDVVKIWHRSPPVPGTQLRNVIRVDLDDSVGVDLGRLERHFYTTSSCGVCGKASLEALQTQSVNGAAIGQSTFRIGSAELTRLPERLRAEQRVFGVTGGLHAAGLFDAEGVVKVVREDVGRHNAMDKLLGRLFLDGGLPAPRYGVLVSGRTSFELVQKIAMAGVPMLAAVGAPSSLAVELAREFDITLVGFLRDGRYNIYSAEQRISTDDK